MDTEVNWYRLGRAVWWYKSLGYKYMEVPWIVSEEPYNGTRPLGAPAFSTVGGNLVASGEQSFMQLMEEGSKVGKAMCCTPCFRVEPFPDEYHLPYFMKLELIHKSGGKEGLEAIIQDAFNFFQNGCDIRCEIITMPDGSFDIVGKKSQIELGSYGIRRWKDFIWVYGTGVAEPRTSQVYELEKI